MKHERGVTLFELMIVIAIVAIIALIGIPAMNASLENASVRTVSTDFTASLNYARTEAIKRDTPVSICPSQDTVNYTSCGTAADWTNGWITFIDPAGDGTLTAENRLEIRDSFNNVLMTTTAARITYQGRGFVSAGATNYTIRGVSASVNYARLIELSTTGRSRVTEGGY